MEICLTFGVEQTRLTIISSEIGYCPQVVLSTALQNQKDPNRKHHHDIALMIGVELAPENDPSKALI